MMKCAEMETEIVFVLTMLITAAPPAETVEEERFAAKILAKMETEIVNAQEVEEEIATSFQENIAMLFWKKLDWKIPS